MTSGKSQLRHPAATTAASRRPQPCPALFITGTDTDVGKTVVVAGLAAAATAAGLSVAVMKPVQTGLADDIGDLATVARLTPGLTLLPPDLACVYAFPLPASPHLAAEVAGEEIDPARIIAAVAAARRHPGLELLLIEGAGGIMVPLRRDYLLRELIRRLAVPTILTVRPGLGTINHTLLSINALRDSKIPLAGLVVNRLPARPGTVEKDNLRYFREQLPAPLLAVVPAAATPAAAVAAMRRNRQLQAFLDRSARQPETRGSRS